MGRVRTKTVKRSARVIVERFYSKLALDFDTNKRVRVAGQSASQLLLARLLFHVVRPCPAAYCRRHLFLHPSRIAQVTDDVALVPSKRMRNKIAGFVTVRCAIGVCSPPSSAPLFF